MSNFRTFLAFILLLCNLSVWAGPWVLPGDGFHISVQEYMQVWGGFNNHFRQKHYYDTDGDKEKFSFGGGYRDFYYETGVDINFLPEFHLPWGGQGAIQTGFKLPLKNASWKDNFGKNSSSGLGDIEFYVQIQFLGQTRVGMGLPGAALFTKDSKNDIQYYPKNGWETFDFAPVSLALFFSYTLEGSALDGTNKNPQLSDGFKKYDTRLIVGDIFSLFDTALDGFWSIETGVKFREAKSEQMVFIADLGENLDTLLKFMPFRLQLRGRAELYHSIAGTGSRENYVKISAGLAFELETVGNAPNSGYIIEIGLGEIPFARNYGAGKFFYLKLRAQF